MAENSKIQWTNHTVNFWTGCKKVSDGCRYCYMYRDQERYGRNPTEVLKVNQSTIDRILRKAKPGDKIFTCSWSDFFIEEADEWRDWAWDRIKSRPDLKWQILTKRPERIKECLPDDWGEGWDNVWLGVTAENQREWNMRVYDFLRVPAKIHFASIEPLLGPIIDMSIELTGKDMGRPTHKKGLDWIIVGGESGNENGKYKYRPAEIEWFNIIVEECKKYNIPVFVKQLGTYLSKGHRMSDRHGGEINDFPKNLQIRQFPNY